MNFYFGGFMLVLSNYKKIIEYKRVEVMSNNIMRLLKPNKPENLTTETDFMGTIPKGEMIVEFLDKISETNAEFEMIALYGQWGQGKTSLMKWIDNELSNKENFETVFFEAWKHEKDNDIALSLLDVIVGSFKTLTNDEIKQHLYSSLLAILKGITKSITVDLFGMKINVEKIIQEIDNSNKSLDETTYHSKIKEFETKFCELETKILGEKTNKRLVVLIDDLDRCEPENVLNLLSVIKLFFTYGKRTIFFCGLDKEAVNKAVLHKYKDVVKSEEYLEKIFDVSFSMPKEVYPIRLLEKYFTSEKGLIGDKEKEYKVLQFISSFFTAINFGNSRHLRKVLNKYMVIKYLKEQGIGDDFLIPNLNCRFYIVTTLFIIILYEFHPKEFDILKNYNRKILYYINNSKGKDEDAFINAWHNLLNIESSLKKMITSKKFRWVEDLNNVEVNEQSRFLLFQCAFITFFSPLVDEYEFLDTRTMYTYINQFSKGNNLLYSFCKFISTNMDCVAECINETDDDEYPLENIFEMAELYL
jgi:hypothetical protein